MLEIYVDGSCLSNGKENNEGGYGLIALKNGKIVKMFGKRSTNTTNNREELKAIFAGLMLAGDKDATIYTDSAYCLNTVQTWMYSWATKGWRKSNKEAPENLDLIKPMYDHMQFRTNITFKKVKGHANNTYNEIADALATNNEAKLERYLNLTKE